ncbi:MAG: PduL/EutD family phosphate acyltransferase, partial [Oscillospiraceae bacterium]|nr:PduL/EutD family phosphate acyltransferase [Oscillospiraceae bacterium]
MEKFIVEVSARHAHFKIEDVEVLFGKGKRLTSKRELSQPGQFLCNERVKVSTEKGEMNMSIIGPERPFSQVEISATDARVFKLNPPIRESGDIEGSPGCKVT